ncbi:MAG: hypothetical protein HFG01_12790 [Oscillibacter sp.]|uniref:hypothetical protein n=1 Tax=Oscillibacter sp. 1-3 TaxID=1235797 RepID=UPI00033D73C7|nr:hypothetical protein [Oscillibacter sp. 1-3]EOS65679.1 hypothetical protein C816_02034 [Oscillibacter sp. 1-3]MCI8804176.1 hypothetical protein [Oscillibacter sp.]MCI9512224.1 hypothetical protein [Oscillibacter sp.]
MLRKLLKHEFRATGRIMLPVTGILLATSVAANLSLRYLLDSRAWFFSMLGILLLTAFGFAIFGVFIVSFVLMIQRFYKNLLQDEGYVMLTLPVSIHQHIWSKLIVSSVWFIITGLAVILACCITAFDITIIKEILQGLGELFQELRKVQAYYAINGTAILMELIALAFLSLVAMCLQFYAALAAGHSLPSHKMAWSVAWYFGLQFAFQIIAFSGINILDQIGFFNWGIFYPEIHLDAMAGIHIGLFLLIFVTVVYGAVFYGITTFFLKKRLNLE